ncbi:MAG TPA: class I SAM-dependent methyltransferase, partial [Acidobacteriota bacterium]|nr:class I SAM-dependent methyltransferase [Acidobacteriota bacterium]
MLRCLVPVVAIALTVGGQTADQDYWNKIFGGKEAHFNHAPSRLLTLAVVDRKPGKAVDLGMGEGRNAIFLAQRGWQVTGVDLSDVGVAQAKKRAAELGVQLETVVEDLDKYDFGRERWDLITLFYMHAWYHLSTLDSARRLLDALKPGGLLVIEGFAGGQVGYKTNELLGAFFDL